MKTSALLTLAIAASLLLGCGGESGSGGGQAVNLPPPPEVDLSMLADRPQQLLEDALGRLKQYPDDAGLNGHVAMLLHAFRRYEDANKFYVRARKVDPRAGRWTYYQGVALAELKEVAGAAEAFNANLELWENYGPTQLRLARLYFQAAEAADSEALLKKGRETLDALIVSQPDYTPGLIDKAQRLYDQSDDKAALALLEQAIDQDYPGREAHVLMAKIHERAGNDREASRFEVLAAKRPEFGLDDSQWMARIKTLSTTNMGYSERGEAMVKARMLGPATGEFERAVESDDNKLDSRINLIALYGIQGQTEKAEQQYAIAMREGLENGRLHLNIATIRLGLGRHAEAEEAYQKALAIDPFLVKAYQGMSRSSLLQQNYPEAVRWARLAVQRDPKNVKPLVELARALRFAGQYEESVKYFSDAVLYSEGTDQIQSMRSMASTQLQAKDYEGAKATLEKAREVADDAGNNVQALLIDSQLAEVAEAATAATP